MMTTRAILVATTIILQSSLAYAETDYGSGNYLLKHCKHSTTDGIHYDVWDGWCSGAVDALRYVGGVLGDFASCAPSHATNGQATMIVVRYLERHPERLHENFNLLAAQALHEAWPCNRK